MLHSNRPIDGEIMRLRAVDVHNHSRIPDLAVEVRDHMVLIGPNECGKSSLLTLIDSVLTGNRAVLYREITPESLRVPSHPMKVQLSFGDLSPAEKAEFAHEVELSAAGEASLQVNVVAEYDASVDELNIDRTLGRVGVEVRVSNLRLAALRFAHFGADRRMDVALGGGGRSVIKQLLVGVPLGTDGDAIKDAMDRVHEVVQAAEGIKQLKKNVAQSLDRVLPESVSDSHVDVDLPSDRRTDPLGDFELKLRGDESSRALRDNSDGHRSLSTIGLRLAARDAVSILSIDEPEVHLHPAAQRRLARSLRETAPQALVATHSTMVLAEFDPAEVVVMAGDGGLRQFDGPAFSPRHAAQRWLPAVLEPLTSRGLIAVEGPSDVIAVREIARALGVDLDRESVSVFPVHGYRNFEQLFQLLGPHGFDVPMVTIADADELDAVAGYLGVEADELEAAHVYICSKDLEDEYPQALGAEGFARLLAKAGVVELDTLVGWAKVSSPSDLLDEHVAQAARRKKIDAALALAGQLGKDQALAMKPLAAAVDDLLGRLV